ncbi:MAG: hypothetical protein KKA79_01865 [Nanoarchaeota archaeon]|nr:hypothetical protein [Nanoarchaeota archaeon]MCG2717672.1 hypothetical protein [Nanoarchaeota archaeon]
MQDKLLSEFERIGIEAIKKGKTEELDKFLDGVVKNRDINLKRVIK